MEQLENKDSMDIEMVDLTIASESDIFKDETRAEFIKVLKPCNFTDSEIIIDSGDEEEKSQQQVILESSVNSAPARSIGTPFVRDQASTSRATRTDRFASPSSSTVAMDATVNARTSKDDWEVWETYDEAKWDVASAAVNLHKVDFRNDKAISTEVKKELNDDNFKIDFEELNMGSPLPVHNAAPSISSRPIDAPFVRAQPSTSRAATTDTKKAITLKATTADGTTTDNFASQNPSAVPMDVEEQAHTSEAASAADKNEEAKPGNDETSSNEVMKAPKDYKQHVEKLRQGLIILANKELGDDDDGAGHSDRIDKIYKMIRKLTLGQELVFEGSKYAEINSNVTELLRSDRDDNFTREIIKEIVSSLNQKHGYGWSDEAVNTEAASVYKKASKIMKKYTKEVAESKFHYLIPLEGFEPAEQEDPELLQQLSKNAELNEQNIQNFMKSSKLFTKWID